MSLTLPGTLAPYMRWSKTRSSPKYDLAGSNVLTCSVAELPGASEAIELFGRNDNGYQPLLEAIARRYGVRASHVTTAQGTSGANFLVCAALIGAGDDVLVESPGYDPLLAPPRMFGANIVRFSRTFEDGWALDPSRVRAAMTSRTRLIIITNPQNPTGTLSDVEALRAVGRIAAGNGAHVLVDEVYLDASGSDASVAATLGDSFITTNSLTKSYGLSGLRSGWVLSSEAVAERLRQARDVIDGTGPIVTERLSVLAFEQLNDLIARTRRLLDTNTALVRDFLHARPELEFVYPAGGTVVFPRLRAVDNTDTLADRLMREYETAVVPGRFFEAPAHFRLGFGGATEPLRGGLAAIGAALDARAWA